MMAETKGVSGNVNVYVRKKLAERELAERIRERMEKYINPLTDKQVQLKVECQERWYRMRPKQQREAERLLREAEHRLAEQRHHGTGGRIRTPECGGQNPTP